jgi:hypothetical protein
MLPVMVLAKACRTVMDKSGNGGSNKGHASLDLQSSCVLAGCHLRRKVFEFAVSHGTHKPRRAAEKQKIMGQKP